MSTRKKRIEFGHYGTMLSKQDDLKNIKNDVLKDITDCQTVVFDFKGVEDVGVIFASRLFSGLEKSLGREWMQNNLSIINEQPNVKAVLNSAFNLKRT